MEHKSKLKKDSESSHDTPLMGSLPPEMAEKIGARMRDLRLERGLSLSQMRKRGSLPQSQASAAERGLVAITLNSLQQVATALDVPLFVMLTIPEDDPLSSVIEEIRQAYDGDVRKAAPHIRRRLGLSDMKMRRARRR